MTEPRVRIIKCDPHNYEVQELKHIKSTNSKTGEVTERDEWQNAGYFGSHLDWAIRFAHLKGLPCGTELLGEIEKATDQIILEMRGAVSA